MIDTKQVLHILYCNILSLVAPKFCIAQSMSSLNILVLLLWAPFSRAICHRGYVIQLLYINLCGMTLLIDDHHHSSPSSCNDRTQLSYCFLGTCHESVHLTVMISTNTDVHFLSSNIFINLASCITQFTHYCRDTDAS